MSDVPLPKLPGPVRGRPFEKGRSGNPAGRRTGSRNKATLAAAALFAGESEALIRKAVELALAGDRPQCGSASNEFCRHAANAPSISPCRRSRMQPIFLPRCRRLPRRLARGDITPGEAATIAAVVDTFARAIDTTRRRAFNVDPLQILAMGDYNETEGYDEADDYNETEDCDS